MATFIKIATVTVGAGGSSTATFTSIPSTYTDLMLMLSYRSTTAGLYQGTAQLTFNSSTAANYSLKRVYGTGSAAGSSTGSALTYARVSNNQASAGNTASTFGNSAVYIPNYTSTVAKSFSEDSVSESNITEAYPQLSAYLWNPSSNVAITSITLTCSADLFAQYSTFTLYGISKS